VSSRGVELTPVQLAEARRKLGLPADAPELVVQAAIMLDLGLADELIAEVESVLGPEMEFIEMASRFGWRLDP
jgi:hypothetical protein